jgi:hypothetical protein
MGDVKTSAPFNKTVVWGDSHAEALIPGISDTASKLEKPLLFAGRHGCSIGSHLLDKSWKARECSDFDGAMYQWLLDSTDVKQVILASRWSSLRDEKSLDSANSLAQVVNGLTSAGKKVYIVGPVPDVRTQVPRALYLKSLGIAQDVEIRSSEEEFKSAQTKVLTSLKNIALLPNVTLVLPHEVLCTHGWCAVMTDGSPLYFDDNHLTTTGAKYVAKILEPAFL